MNFIDMTGTKWGRLSVVQRIDNLNSQAAWRCICECGNETIVRGNALRNGIIQSCGCQAADQSRIRWTKHGKSRSLLYLMLRAARQRSKRKGITFNLALEDMPDIPDICPVLSIPIRSNVGGKSTSPNSPSLDRIIPALGYVKNNIRIISHRANQIKSDASPEELCLVAKDAIKIVHDRDINAARNTLIAGLGASPEMSRASA